MICCNKERRTRFCPDCGKELYPSTPLAELGAHIQVNIQAIQVTLDRYAKHPSTDDRLIRRRQRIEQRLAKWQSWADALNGLQSPKQ